MAPPRRNMLLTGEWMLAFGLAAGGGLLSRLFIHEAGISGIWFANGLLVGFLLYARSGTWAHLLAACALGQVAIGILTGDPLAGMLAATVFNTLEVFIAAWPLRQHVS